MLYIYYSSGNVRTDEFPQNPFQSLGGFITTVKMVNGLESNLFGSITNFSMSNETEEYRLVFLKNETGSGITNLEVHFDVPEKTTQTDPSLLSPSVGDEFIIPPFSIGDWKGNDGRAAEWNGTKWDITIPNFSSFELAFLAPAIVKLDRGGNVCDNVPFVDIVQNGYSIPYGIDFFVVDGAINALQIGDGTLADDATIAIWIKRKAQRFSFKTDDFVLPNGDPKYNKPLEFPQKIELIFTYA